MTSLSNANPYARPRTIGEALEHIAAGYPRAVVFGDLADWLFFSTDSDKIRDAIEIQPQIKLDNEKLFYEYVDYLAFAEWLANKYELPIPSWVTEDRSVIPDEFYAPAELEYRNLMFERFPNKAIPEYKNRGIFMTEGNLTRG
jgi:hypothetical protein